MFPILHFHDFQLTSVWRTLQPPLLIDHPSQLAHCQAMQDGKRIHPHKALEAGLANRAIHKIVRIGTIEHNELLMVLRTSLHHIVHRTDIGIETSTDILNIEHDHIHIGQLLACRFLVFAIDRNDRNPRLHVAAIFDLSSRITRSTEAMLGSEHLMHVYSFR